MRNIKYIVLLIITFLCINTVSAVDNIDPSLKVYDFADVMTDVEESKLKEFINTFIDEFNMDMAVVTVSDNYSKSTMEYADDFYDYNDFGVGKTNDGLVFVIDFTRGTDEFWISTTGNAILMYDDYRINAILDDIDEVYYSNDEHDDYFGMFVQFIKSSGGYAKLGIPSSNKNMKLDKNGTPYYEEPMPWLAIVIAALLVSTIFVAVFIAKNKMVAKKTNANDYVIKDSIKVLESDDHFVSTNTTRTKISSSSSSGGGGSSFHSGSSGTSHGGGGRSH